MVKRQEELKMHQKTQNELLGGDVSNVQETHPGRQVGMKAKREDDDVEWQEAAIPGIPFINYFLINHSITQITIFTQFIHEFLQSFVMIRYMIIFYLYVTVFDFIVLNPRVMVKITHTRNTFFL